MSTATEKDPEEIREEVERQVALDVLESLGIVYDPDQSKVSKGRADYHEPPKMPPELPDDTRCGHCAHFVKDELTDVDGPMCKVVEGTVDFDGVCREFYADVGFFADNDLGGAGVGDDVRVSQTLERAGLADWSDEDLQDLLDLLVEEVDRNRG